MCGKGKIMQENIISLNEGQLLFKQNEALKCAYLIVDGQILLERDNKFIESREKGSFVGESVIADSKASFFTAKAKGNVVLQKLTAEEFKIKINQDGKAASKVIDSLVSQLKNVESKAAISAQAANTETKKKKIREKTGKSLSQNTEAENQANLKEDFSIIQWISGKLGLKEDKQKPSLNTIDIEVAPIIGDYSGKIRAKILAALKTSSGVFVHRCAEKFEVNDEDREFSVYAAYLKAMERLKNNKNDMLVFAKIHQQTSSVEIFMVSACAENKGLPAFYSNAMVLNLPLDFNKAGSALLKVAAYSAIRPARIMHENILKAEVIDTLKNQFKGLEQYPIQGLQQQKALSSFLCYVNALMFAANSENDHLFIQKSIKILEMVLPRLYKLGEQGSLFCAVNWALAMLYYEQAKKSKKIDDFDKAIELLDNAAKNLDKRFYAKEWATLVAKLGAIFYRRGVLFQQTEDVKKSVTCYKNSLLFFRADLFPVEAAELYNNIAKSELLNANVKTSVKHADRAIDAAKNAYKYDKNLISALNNIASSYFIKAKIQNQNVFYKKAAALYEQIQNLYKNQGDIKKSKVAAKNYKLSINEYEKENRRIQVVSQRQAWLNELNNQEASSVAGKIFDDEDLIHIQDSSNIKSSLNKIVKNTATVSGKP